ncbi:hypothetical protein Cadr_000013315 [Camelus dromedarius]|uniref:Uncharacterized protein n=1 Tax=Camelus dromedarius TaxID=9838 RepID=A0A5N4DB46_CAMDR|nr:hypothetical protein Cadr_000013315 [Camelus dromedarius]
MKRHTILGSGLQETEGSTIDAPLCLMESQAHTGPLPRQCLALGGHCPLASGVSLASGSWTLREAPGKQSWGSCLLLQTDSKQLPGVV